MKISKTHSSASFLAALCFELVRIISAACLSIFSSSGSVSPFPKAESAPFNLYETSVTRSSCVLFTQCRGIALAYTELFSLQFQILLNAISHLKIKKEESSPLYYNFFVYICQFLLYFHKSFFSKRSKSESVIVDFTFSSKSFMIGESDFFSFFDIIQSASVISSFVPTHSKGFIPSIQSNSLKSGMRSTFSKRSAQKMSLTSDFSIKALSIV